MATLPADKKKNIHKKLLWPMHTMEFYPPPSSHTQNTKILFSFPNPKTPAHNLILYIIIICQKIIKVKQKCMYGVFARDMSAYISDPFSSPPPLWVKNI